jgi:hypothetical protein
MQKVYDNLDQYKKILHKHREGKGDGIRCITTIDNDNKDLINIFLNIGVQIRQLRNLPPMNFVVHEALLHNLLIPSYFICRLHLHSNKHIIQ